MKTNKPFKNKIVIFKAVDGQDPGKLPRHRQRTNGRVGCYLSHQGVWKDIVKRGHEFAIITEDDAHLHTHLLQDIEYLKDQMIEKDLDVLLLHWRPVTSAAPGTSPFPVVQALEGEFWGTHLLMVSKKGAKNLLEKMNPLGDTPIDVDLYEQNDAGTIKVGLANSPSPYGKVRRHKSQTEMGKVLHHESQTEKMEGTKSGGLFLLAVLAVLFMLGFVVINLKPSTSFCYKNRKKQ